MSDAEKTKTFHLSTEALYRFIIQNDVSRGALLTVLKFRFYVIRRLNEGVSITLPREVAEEQSTINRGEFATLCHQMFFR